MPISRLVLGGASFAKMTTKDVSQIIDYAYANGIRRIDTAPLYGKSQALIGDICKGSDFLISTKADCLGYDELNSDLVYKSFETSLYLLKRDSVDTLFLHSVPISKISSNSYDALHKLKTEGYVTNIGYSGDGYDLEKALRNDSFDSFMFTLNPIDTGNYKLLNSHSSRKYFYLKRIYANGVFKFDLQKEFLYLTRLLRNRPIYREHTVYFDRYIQKFGTRLNFSYKDRYFMHFALGILGEQPKLTIGVSSLKNLKRALALEQSFNMDKFDNDWEAAEYLQDLQNFPPIT